MRAEAHNYVCDDSWMVLCEIPKGSGGGGVFVGIFKKI